MSKLAKSFILTSLAISCFACIVQAEEKSNNVNLPELVKSNPDCKVAWSTMLKGEWSIPEWMLNLQGSGEPAVKSEINGQKYTVCVMRSEVDSIGDFVIVLFTSDHKKCWSVEVTVPAALRESIANPEKYATLRYYGHPAEAVKKALRMELDKEVAAHPILVSKSTTVKKEPPLAPKVAEPSVDKPAQAANPVPTTPQDDEKARKFRGELHAKKGKEMMAINNFRQAESEYKEASKFQPENVQYLESYANAALKANDCREAIEAFERLLKVDGVHHQEAHEQLGECLFKMRRYDQAIDEYQKAVPVSRNKGEVLCKIAEIRLGQAQHTEAINTFRQAIKAAPTEGKAYRSLASILWNIGNKAEALSIYKTGAQNAPKDGDLQAAYAYALMSDQQWQAAAKAYTAAAMIKGSTPEIEQGYKSAMEHVAYEERKAQTKTDKKRK